MRHLPGVLALTLAAAVLAFSASGLPRGFEYFFNLEFDKAIAEFERNVAANPNDPAAHNHLAQGILYKAMFRAGALESELVTGGNAFLRREKVNPTPQEQRRFDEAIGRAMSLAQDRLRRDPNDTGALYALGVAHGLRGNYNFLVRKAWHDALRDAAEANKLHARVTELDPDNVDARLVQGVYDYMVGNLPWYYRVLGFLAGYRGDKERGIATIRYVAEHGINNKYDAQVLLAVAYRRERRAQEAIPLLENLIRRFPRNFLFRLELVQMYSDLGNKKAALEELARVEALKKKQTPGFEELPPEKIAYFRGNLLFWYNDLEEAVTHLMTATAGADKLDLNTGVLAWMRLGQSYDLLGEREKAIAAYRQAMAFAPGSEVARESAGYIRSPYQRKRAG